MYVDTIIPRRRPGRKVAKLENLTKIMIKWAKMCDVYHSIYFFSKINENGRPDWKSADLSTIMLDIDVINSDGNMHDENSIKETIEFLREKNFTRHYKFTGGGYNVFVQIENGSQESIREAHFYLRNDLELVIDKAAIDIKRGTRYVPSYNFAKKSFVGYITEEQALKPFHETWKIFQKPRKTKPIFYGDKKWKIGGLSSGYAKSVVFDPGPLEKARNEKNINQIEMKYGKVCDVILSIARQERVSHHERFFIILYIKDVLLVPYSEFSCVYKAILGNSRDYNHSILEGQPRSAYSRNTRFRPILFKKYGYCPKNCTRCEERMKENREMMSCLFC